MYEYLILFSTLVPLEDLLSHKGLEYEQSNRIECNKNHFSITLRRELMSIGIVTHDAASIDVTGEKAASNQLLFLYDKTKLIVLRSVYFLYGYFNLNTAQTRTDLMNFYTQYMIRHTKPFEWTIYFYYCKSWTFIMTNFYIDEPASTSK